MKVKKRENSVGTRWYTHSQSQVWIVERLQCGNFEIRKYLIDGSVEKELLDYFDGVTTININQMNRFEIE